MAIEFRRGNFGLYLDRRNREDSRYSGYQLGIRTYAGSDGEQPDEVLKASYFELGTRLDHFAKQPVPQNA